MSYALIVKEAFAEFFRGQIITDLVQVEQIIASGLAHYCQKLLVEPNSLPKEEVISVPVPISPADGSNSSIED
jgi:hypothetical protein